jgi:hypothetical protein
MPPNRKRTTEISVRVEVSTAVKICMVEFWVMAMFKLVSW